jgi:hypothetical protein
MRDPELVFKAQLAASALERAWQRWRLTHGLAADPMPAVSSYVGYSLEEPWGQPRVVFGLATSDAEQLAALLDRHDCIGPVHAMIAAKSGAEGHVESGRSDVQPLPVPPQAPSMLAEQKTSGNGRTVFRPRSWRADAEDGPVYREVSAARWASVAVAVGEASAEEAGATSAWTKESGAYEAVSTDTVRNAVVTDAVVTEAVVTEAVVTEAVETEAVEAEAVETEASPEPAGQSVAQPTQVAGQERAEQERAGQDELAEHEQARQEQAGQQEAGQDQDEAAAPAVDGDRGAVTKDAGSDAGRGSEAVNPGGTISDASVADKDAAVGEDTSVADADVAAGGAASSAVKDAAAIGEDAGVADAAATVADQDSAETVEPVPDPPGPLTRAASTAKVEAEARIKAARRQGRTPAQHSPSDTDTVTADVEPSESASELAEVTGLGQGGGAEARDDGEATPGADEGPEAISAGPSEPGSRGRQQAGYGRRNRGGRGYPIPRLPKAKRSGSVPGS